MAKVQSPVAFIAGLITAGAGLYFVATGVRLAVAPGVPIAFGLLVVCAGLTFWFSGVRTATQSLAASGAADDSAPAADAPAAPAWLLQVQSFAPVATVFCLAAVATWIALAGGSTAVTRLAFGFGALVTWAYFIVLVRRTIGDAQEPAQRDVEVQAGPRQVSAMPAILARDALLDAAKPRGRRRARPPFRFPMHLNRKVG